MGYSYKPTDVNKFFKEQKVVPNMPPSFWWKAIPAATEIGFGIEAITEDTITVIAPDKKKLIYKHIKNADSDLTSLGIVLTHAILTSKLH